MSLFYSGTSQIIAGVFLEVPASALSLAHWWTRRPENDQSSERFGNSAIEEEFLWKL